jgi:uncharacterized membrane protein YphA (DoxX/SURF4 family)
MDHTISSFPSRVPGSGLLLLRLLLAGYLIVEGTPAAVSGSGATDVRDVVIGGYGMIAVLCGALAAAGFLTRVTQTCLALVELVVVGAHLWAPGYAALTFGSPRAAIMATGIATGLVLLGPGAYSVDAFLFGRREIVIPPVARQRTAQHATAGLSPAYPGSNVKR